MSKTVDDMVKAFKDDMERSIIKQVFMLRPDAKPGDIVYIPRNIETPCFDMEPEGNQQISESKTTVNIKR